MESMSCCRLLGGGQHTLPEREAKAMMMMMPMMGRPTYSHNRRTATATRSISQHNTTAEVCISTSYQYLA